MKLIEQQYELESEMRSTGVEYYKSQVAKAVASGGESNTLYGILAMKQSVDAVTEAIRVFLDDSFNGKPSRGASAAYLLKMLDEEVAAYLGLKFVMDGISHQHSLTKVAMKIAGALEDEFKFGCFKEQEPKWFNKIARDVNKRTSNRLYRRYAIIHTMNKKALIEYEPWSKQEKMHLGCKVIDLIVQSTGICKLVTHTYGRNRRMLHVTATDETLDWVSRVNKRSEALSPRFMPCVIPPRPWSSAFSGGYHTKHIHPLPLVKTTNKRYFDELEFHEMPEEYDAINALQNTGWRVNKWILDVMQQCWESGEDWGGLPARNPFPLPPSPFPNIKKSDMDEAQLGRFVQWKHAASRVHQTNARMTSKRMQLVRTMNMAEKFSEYQKFFFVYQMDFRGRKYVTSSFLSPQGPDYARALLEFGDGKPLGKRGLYWLAVHGANVFGYDKVSFDDRVKWVEENEESILDYARDPFQARGWTKADKPWCFLAFCHEWKRCVVDGGISYLPVSLDGSNNGLQHLSAMLRDTRGALATNLRNSDVPQDIYQDVADAVIDMLKREDDPMARQWLDFGVNRKTTKRPVMVVPYGGQLYSTRQYIEDYIQERIELGHTNPWGDDLFEPSRYLSEFVWQAIGGVIQSARQVMDWLQEVSYLVSSENIPLIWETPTGFLVHQMYPEMRSRRITTTIDNTLIKPSLREPNHQKTDRRRAVNGSSPNFVHSMDSSAMTKTINRCVKLGITDFAMIHDSYGTHACDTDALFAATREAFVELYKDNDVLEQFQKAAEEVLEEVPTPPKRGDFDIEEVLKSDYFFA